MTSTAASPDTAAGRTFNATSRPTFVSRALRRALCGQIVRDEAAHLQYQAGTLARLRLGRSAIRRALTELFHALLLHGTVLAVWMENRSLFLRDGYTLAIFRRESEHEVSTVQMATYTCTLAGRSSIETAWTCNSKESSLSFRDHNR